VDELRARSWRDRAFSSGHAAGPGSPIAESVLKPGASPGDGGALVLSVDPSQAASIKPAARRPTGVDVSGAARLRAIA